jgi:hypothetical protein
MRRGTKGSYSLCFGMLVAQCHSSKLIECVSN